MSFGHFAAGFADAWADSVMQKREADRRDKMAKLQGELYELQIKQAQEQQAAQGQVMDMMTGQLGEFELGQEGLGEFNITPGQTPEFIPGRNEMPQLRGDREPMSLPEMMVDAQGQAAMVRAGYASPRDFQEQSEVMRLLDAAGYEKGTPEYQEAVKSYLTRGNESSLDVFLKEQQATINLQMLEENLAAKRRERSERERTEVEKLRGRQNAVGRTFDHIKEIQQLQESLSGTLLASGVPINDAVRQAKAGQLAFMQVLGLDPTEQMNLLNQLDQYDRLSKLYSVGILESLERFDLGNPTDVKFNELKRAVASGDKTAFSNLQLLADALEEMLDKAYEKQVPIAQEEEIRAWIKQIKLGEGSAAQKPGDPAVDVPKLVAEIKTWTEEKISNLSEEEFDKMAPDAVAALAKRMEELGMK